MKNFLTHFTIISVLVVSVLMAQSCSNTQQDNTLATEADHTTNQELEMNKAIATEFFEILLTHEGRVDHVHEIIADDITMHRVPHKGTRIGKAAIEHLLELNHEHLDDKVFNVEDIFGEDDKVAIRFTSTSLDQKSGNNLDYSGIFIFQIEDGKIIEIWENLDDLQFLQQVGILPEFDYEHKHEQE